MSFKKNKYVIIKSAISKDLAAFCMNYLLMKKQVYDTCLSERYLSPFENIMGFYYGNFITQMPTNNGKNNWS